MRKLTQRKLRKLLETETKGWFKNANGKDLKVGQPISDVGIEMRAEAWAGGKNLVDPKDLAKEASGNATVTTLEIMKIVEQRILRKSKKVKSSKLDEKKLRRIIRQLIIK